LFVFNILDESDAEFTQTKQILIKNKNADSYCRVVVRESEFVTIEDIEAVIKDVSGKVIKELDSDDINEAEASFSSFYSGQLYNWFELTHHTYPFIFEYTVKKSSTYKLIKSGNVEFSYHSYPVEIKPDTSMTNSNVVYTWEATNLPKVKNEDYMPPEYDYPIGVLFKANKFYLGNYAGSSENWNSFAEFYYNLSNGRYTLPQKAKDEISLLLNGITDKKEKVKILYKHLQEKNRYVDIEMGINGWQPQSASDVYTNRYGDCKDLSTYMVAVLEHSGIKAYPALALTRSQGIVNLDFPSQQFNHCITMVPFDADTLWLECTASYLDLEDTPYSIEGIDALAVIGAGGQIIRTPQKSSSHNLSKSIIAGELSYNGNYQFDANILTTGNRKNYLKNNFSSSGEKDSKIFLHGLLNDNYTNVAINNFEIDDLNNSTNEYIIKATGLYNKFTSTRGNRIFVNLNIYNKLTPADLPSEKVDERKFPIYYNYPFLNIDSVLIKIPNGFELEAMPKDQTIEYPFAKYSTQFYSNADTVSHTRHFEIKEKLIPVEKYKDYLEFIQSVIKSDKATFVFKKK
jgi:hypothetical protein